MVELFCRLVALRNPIAFIQQDQYVHFRQCNGNNLIYSQPRAFYAPPTERRAFLKTDIPAGDESPASPNNRGKGGMSCSGAIGQHRGPPNDRWFQQENRFSRYHDRDSLEFALPCFGRARIDWGIIVPVAINT